MVIRMLKKKKKKQETENYRVTLMEMHANGEESRPRFFLISDLYLVSPIGTIYQETICQSKIYNFAEA